MSGNGEEEGQGVVLTASGTGVRIETLIVWASGDPGGRLFGFPPRHQVASM